MRSVRRARVPILLYHWFTDQRVGDHEASSEHGISPADFRRQLEWFSTNDWTPIRLQELVSKLNKPDRIPPKSTCLTFDDAYVDFYEQALPLLGQTGVPATIFAVAGRVGESNLWDRGRGEPRRELLDWSKLRDIADAGVEIGSHSLTHQNLCTLSDRDLRRECLDSRLLLEDRLGRQVRLFAYPHGRSDLRVERAVRKAGYDAACSVLFRFGDLFRSSRFSLRRVTVHGDRGFLSFRARLKFAGPYHGDRE